MGRKKGGGKNPDREWFKKYYTDNPDVANQSSNEPVYEAWKAEHNGREMTEQQKTVMNSVKPLYRTKKTKSKRGRKPAGRPAASPASSTTTKPKSSTLQQLEIMLDECLAIARGADNGGLDSVVDNLRKARNGVVVISHG